MKTRQGKIEELIAKLCPTGVEFIVLEELANIETGKQLNKSSMAVAGEYLVLNGGIKPSGFYHEYNTNENTIAISQGGASAGYVNFVTTKFWAGAHCFVIKPTSKRIENRFLYFVLKNGQTKLQNAKMGAGIPGLSKKEIQQFKIPLPPLEIQSEIVKILNSFTELEAELEAELEVRKKQYVYYGSKLLTFDKANTVRWVTLKEIAKIKNGKDWKKLNNGDIPVYGSGGVMNYVDTFAYNKPTVLIPRKGSISKIYYLDKPFWNVDTIYYTEINTSKIIPKFFYYYLKTIDLEKLDTGSGRPSLTQTILDKIEIPLPSIADQESIITKLDKFDKLVNNISLGLPAEISARRSQYEYYRSKILTFLEV